MSFKASQSVECADRMHTPSLASRASDLQLALRAEGFFRSRVDIKIRFSRCFALMSCSDAL